MTDAPLLDYAERQKFHGVTFDESLDGKRLRGQNMRVFNAMKSGAWFTLAQLHIITRDPEASISARIRGFKQFGVDHDRERIGNGGTWRYRLLTTGDSAARQLSPNSPDRGKISNNCGHTTAELAVAIE